MSDSCQCCAAARRGPPSARLSAKAALSRVSRSAEKDRYPSAAGNLHAERLPTRESMLRVSPLLYLTNISPSTDCRICGRDRPSQSTCPNHILLDVRCQERDRTRQGGPAGPRGRNDLAANFGT